MELPVLYSFRRCPYAIRARLALQYCGISCELREIELKNKPQEMLSISSKGTVPVLILNNGNIIDESLDIMLWALQQKDQHNWLTSDTKKYRALISENDSRFKYYLDRYKYSDRYPEHSQVYYRQQAELFLRKLESCLNKHNFLSTESEKLVDMAIFPFIRQFAFVDKSWFDNSIYVNLQDWLNRLLQTDLFVAVMTKYKPWQNGDHPVYFAQKNK